VKAAFQAELQPMARPRAGQAPNGKPKRNENRAEQAERRLHGGHSKNHGDAEKDAGNQVAAIGEEIDFVFGKLEPGFQSSDASLDDSVIFVVQPELIAAIEEDGGDLFFVGSEHADVGFAAIEGVRASLFLDAEVATDSHVQNGGRKSFIVKAHADEEACARGREIRGRLIERHDDAASRIAADGVPGEGIVEKKEKQAEQDEQGDAIVGQKIVPLLLRSGRGDESLRPGEDNGETFVRAKRRSGCKEERAIGLLAVRESALEGMLQSAEAVEGDAALRNALRQRDRGGGLVDTEDPAVAGDVPIHFVVVGEKS